MERIQDGAEEFFFERGQEKGCLLIHGFTGSPAQMRPMGEFLAREGITVLGIRLPGHGTEVSNLHRCSFNHWINTAQEGLTILLNHCQEIVVAGLSMGGTLALYLAKENQYQIQGVIPICVPVYFRDKRAWLIPLIKYFKKTWRKGRGIKDPLVSEIAYNEISLPGVHELLKLCKIVKNSLPSIMQKALIIGAREDRTVSIENAYYIMDHLGTEVKKMVILENSYHVATLDYDAPVIFQKTISFIKGEDIEEVR